MKPLLRRMQAISLEVATEDQDGTYATLVLDLDEGQRIVTGVPLERGREVRIAPGTPVRILFSQADGLHVLTSRVVKRDAVQPSLELAWPQAAQRVQRRNHVRVEVMLPCELRVRGGSGDEERRIACATLDLSAGGVRLSLPEPLAAEQQVGLSLPLPELDRLDLEARVVRAGTQQQADGARFWAALEFVGLLESVRKELTRFVFEVQREQLRRGVA